MTVAAPIRPALGLDFGTTNSVVARGREDGAVDLVDFAAPDGSASVFRTALCFWQEGSGRAGLSHEAGPWAIAEFLDYPQGCRFLQSFKSQAANKLFDQATIFESRLRFEELGGIFLDHMLAHGGAALTDLPERVIVGRPVRFVGARPDAALARTRYDAMFARLGREVHYVYEPLGAAYSYVTRLDEPATLLVADFGGGTSDFSIVRVDAPGAARRCTPLGSAGVGIAGDRFDFRIMDHLVLPMLGKGGTYRSFDKVLEIPQGHFTDFGDWSRLALMRNRKTLAELARLERSATDAEAIGRMIAVVENELGYPLYDAVGRLKRALSSEADACFAFESDDLVISADVTRAQFEEWITPDLEQIGQAVDAALVNAQLRPDQIDRVFLTGGSSLIPAVRRMFEARFGASRIDSGEELTSIAHGLALIGQLDDIGEWTLAQDDD